MVSKLMYPANVRSNLMRWGNGLDEREDRRDGAQGMTCAAELAMKREMREGHCKRAVVMK